MLNDVIIVFININNLSINKMEVKNCSKCKTVKPINAFYNDRTCKDGKCSCCKDCKNIANNQRN